MPYKSTYAKSKSNINQSFAVLLRQNASSATSTYGQVRTFQTPGYQSQNRKISSGFQVCCGCMPLKTGCFVIGLTGLLLYGLLFLTAVLTTHGIVKTNWLHNYTGMSSDRITDFITGLIIVSLIHITVDVCLVIGAASENQSLCIIWIVVYILILIFKFGAWIVIASYTFGMDEGGAGILGLPFLLLNIYCLSVVWFFEVELNKDNPNNVQKGKDLESKDQQQYSRNNNDVPQDGTNGRNSDQALEDSAPPYQVESNADPYGNNSVATVDNPEQKSQVGSEAGKDLQWFWS